MAAPQAAPTREQTTTSRAVRLDVPVIARYGFDPGSCQFLTEWWRDGHQDETIKETVRCYTPSEFVQLLIGTGLAADRFEVDGKPFDPHAPEEVSGLLASRRSYRVRLALGVPRQAPPRFAHVNS